MPHRTSPRPTQRQIADEVGVSVTTVSRILNPDEANPERWASAKTVDMIQCAAAALGYRPNALAVSLRKSRSDTIGIMVPATGDMSLAAIHSGIDEVARENDMMAILSCSFDDPRLSLERITNLMDHLIAGLVVADSHMDANYIESIREQGVPFTLVHRRHNADVSVTADDIAAGKLAAQHLIGIGRRRLAFVGGLQHSPVSLDQIQGLTSEVAQAGLGAPVIFDTGFDVDAGELAASELIARTPMPDAVFAINDAVAMGLISGLRAQGFRVPQDVAVVASADTPASKAADITSIYVDLNQMGRRSCQLLLDRIAGKPTESEILPVSLVVRGSTSCPTMVMGPIPMLNQSMSLL